MPQDEEQLLHSVALQNAKAILEARQRAEQALLQANQALEQKTAELARSLAMLRATLESTSDGILVTDGEGTITGFNENFLSMWTLPRAVMAGGIHQRVVDLAVAALRRAGRLRRARARDLRGVLARGL